MRKPDETRGGGRHAKAYFHRILSVFAQKGLTLRLYSVMQNQNAPMTYLISTISIPK